MRLPKYSATTIDLIMSDQPDPAAILARRAEQSRARQTDGGTKEFCPDGFIARMRECERLAGKTVYPEMAEIMRKLARLWREMARSLQSEDKSQR